MTFDIDQLTAFFRSLPLSTAEAARLARSHDDRLKAKPFTNRRRSAANAPRDAMTLASLLDGSQH